MTTATIVHEAAAADTITLASLASDTNLAAGCEGTTGILPTAARQIEIWAYGSYDGTTYSGGAIGSDANLTPSEKTLMKLLTIIPTVNTSDKAYQWGPFSLAAAFGGTLPRKTGIFIVHNTGVNLNSTGGNHEVKRTPVKYASA